MKLDLEPNFVELAMDIPTQPGLLFHIDLNFQNLDELHLSASALWVEWFPCTIPGESDEYFKAVSGLLSGEYRILEHWRGKRAIKAELQCPMAYGWKSIKTSTHLPFLPWPRKVFKVVQNLPGVKPMAQNP